VVGSVGEVGEHLRARATLRVGWMGPEEHQRLQSTVAHGGDGRLKWSGGSSMVTVGRVVIGFSSGPRARGKLQSRWLHARRVERKWRLVGSVAAVGGDGTWRRTVTTELCLNMRRALSV
jgi:hypothetical protein